MQMRVGTVSPRGAEGGVRSIYGGNGDVFTAQTSTEALYQVWASVFCGVDALVSCLWGEIKSP